MVSETKYRAVETMGMLEIKARERDAKKRYATDDVWTSSGLQNHRVGILGEHGAVLSFNCLGIKVELDLDKYTNQEAHDATKTGRSDLIGVTAQVKTGRFYETFVRIPEKHLFNNRAYVFEDADWDAGATQNLGWMWGHEIRDTGEYHERGSELAPFANCFVIQKSHTKLKHLSSFPRELIWSRE